MKKSIVFKVLLILKNVRIFYYVENETIGAKKRNGEDAYEVKVVKDSKDFGAEKYKKNLFFS